MTTLSFPFSSKTSGRLLTILICLLTLCLAACNKESSSGGGNQTPQIGTQTKSGADDKKLTIAGIVFQDDQFFKLVELGMKDAAGKSGVELLTANSAGALDVEMRLVDTYIVREVGAIIVSPLSTKASVPALERANKQGIKVITYNTELDAPFVDCAVASDQRSLGSNTGKAAAEYIQNKLGGKANIAMVEITSNTPEQGNARQGGFRDEVTKLPGVKIVAQQDAWLAPNAANVVKDMLTAHPEINLVWAANEGGTIGAVTAVRDTGKAGAIAVFGTDMSEQMGDFLLAEDNVLQAVTGQKPYDIGSISLESAVKLLRGETVEKNIVIPGVLFTREKPEEVKTYQEFLREKAK